MRVARKRAKALDKRVDSPGRVGWKPFSVTYSSSVSDGYSAWTSASLSSLGKPSVAAVKLARLVRTREHVWWRVNIPIKSVEGPEDLLPRLDGQSTKREAFLTLV